ncbi:MAG: hypothetical protein AAF085_13870 [Planctomycetota bacterium]
MVTPYKLDIEKKKRALLSDVGYEWHLAKSIDDQREIGHYGCWAEGFLQLAIDCQVVGFNEPIDMLLNKSKQWLLAAIDSNNFEGSSPLSTYETLSLCNWMLGVDIDIDNDKRLIQTCDRWLQECSFDLPEVSYSIKSYLQVGAFENVLKTLQKATKFSPAKSIKNIRNEAKIAHVIAKAQLGIDVTEEEAADAGRNFLSKKMSEWLSRGFTNRAAAWIRIIYDPNRDSRANAKNLIMKCHDHLPTH